MKLNLSFAQQRLWFSDQILKQKAIFNIFSVMRIKGSISVELLQQAFCDLITRHEILRMRIKEVDAGPLPIIFKPQEFKLGVNKDFLDLNLESSPLDLMAYIKKTISKEFNFQNDFLIKAELVLVGPDEYILIIVVHHIISDEWSMDILLNDLSAFYRSRLYKKEEKLPKLNIQYLDYHMQIDNKINGGFSTKELTYWVNYLDSSPTILALPLDKPRPLELSYKGNVYKEILDKYSLSKIKIFCQKKRITLYIFLVTVFQILLHSITGEDDVVIGHPSANRLDPEVENMIGFFVNVIPLRSQFNFKKTFNKILEENRKNIFEGYENQSVNFDQIVSKINVKRHQNSHPIFQVLFTMHTIFENTLDFGNVQTHFIEVDDQFSKFDLSFFCAEIPEGLSLKMVYSVDLFEMSTIKTILSSYLHLLIELLNNPEEAIGNIPLHNKMLSIRAGEKRYGNYCDPDTGNYFNIRDLFDERVKCAPDKVMIVHDKKEYTYNFINIKANQFANYLSARRIVAGDIIAVYLEPGMDFIISIIGILKVGGIYLPIDIRYPELRIINILVHSRPVLLISDRAVKESFLKEVKSFINLNNDRSKIESCRDIFNTNSINHNKLCIIYTSGSTGAPKGVVYKATSLINRIKWLSEKFPISTQEICILLANISFVDSLGEIFFPILFGIKLIIPTLETAANPELLIEFLSRYRVTRVCMVPTLLRVLLEKYHNLDEILPTLSHLEVSGEVLQKDLVDKVLKVFRKINFINRYGSTEATSILYSKLSICQESKKIKNETLIIDNAELLILDKNLRPMPVGLTGEFFIGGTPVAEGYLENSDLTNERFIKYSWPNYYCGKIYKTGDLGKILVDGSVIISGRSDRQLKINGFRIEVDEIESILIQHPMIKYCVVVARKIDDVLTKLIACLLVEKDVTENYISEDIPKFLVQFLPAYMIPNSFLILKELPLLINGKLDRDALNALIDNKTDVLNQDYNCIPRNTVEYKLSKIWEEVLKIKNISVYDNFFTIGGNSLIAIRLIAKLQQAFSIKYPVANIYKYPVIADMAKTIIQQQPIIKTDVLLPIQCAGDKPPLFLIHTALGFSFSYVALAYDFPDQPIYGINDPGLNGPDKAFTSIEQMASYYIEVIQTIQAHGPYKLGGWSFGGTVALEMASQLINNKYEVDIVILFDSTNYPKPIIKNLNEQELDEIYKDFGIEAIYEKELIKNESVRCMNLLRDHCSKKYNGRVALIKARDDEYTTPFRKEDVYQGWKDIAGRGLEIYSVPGLHHQIFDNKYIKETIKVLKKILSINYSSLFIKNEHLDFIDSSLHYAVENKDTFMINRFLECGANIMSLDCHGNTAFKKINNKN